MNNEYIKKLFEENKEKFVQAGMDILSPEDLKDTMISYITSNMQYDFDIDVLESKLFNQDTIEQDLEEDLEK
ncbi:MAG: hypothetical protein IJI22_05710 [Bacilli bacterium]|nr:hypothetical protein [Bacilli bacterium]